MSYIKLKTALKTSIMQLLHVTTLWMSSM